MKRSRENNRTRAGLAITVFAAAIMGALAVGVRAQQNASERLAEQNQIRGFASARLAAERELERRLEAVPDPALAEKELEFLTSAPHLAGTEASRRIAEHLRDKLRSYGFEAEIAAYKVWLPMPVELQLEMTEPEKMALARPEEPIAEDPATQEPNAVPGMTGYSPSGEATAPVVYVNYGLPEDYEKLASMNLQLEGKIALARFGKSYRGVKVLAAEEHKCAGLILYSDPADDGYVQGDPIPKGPWRPMSGIQRGSVLYIFRYPGDPLSPGEPMEGAAPSMKPKDAVSLPRIPSLPISARDAKELLSRLDGPPVPKGWQGGLPFTYHTGPGRAVAHLRVKLGAEPQVRTLYDVIGKLRGETNDEWVVAGNHHDAWVRGAVDPGSGTVSLLEAARALGTLSKQGWKPRRTIVFGFWDGEEFGLLGSTAWVEDHRAELERKADVYINLDAAVSGPNFGAAGTPSLAQMLREVTRDVEDPQTRGSIFEAWQKHPKDGKAPSSASPGTSAATPEAPQREAKPELGALGSGSDYTPFFQHAGIPSLDLAFTGEYGVYHSIYDDFFWMRHFGDPKFVYHAAMGRLVGLAALRMAEADVLPFDYAAYADAIEEAEKQLEVLANEQHAPLDLRGVRAAAGGMKDAAAKARRAAETAATNGCAQNSCARLNRALVETEQALLAPEGLSGRPWYRHTIYAPGTYTGYAAVVLPGVREALEKKDWEEARKEMRALEVALGRAQVKLGEVAREEGK
jgi:N-acetylated-alpha-linked acidic dipeptidase